jgi:hypothetical protein
VSHAHPEQRQEAGRDTPVGRHQNTDGSPATGANARKGRTPRGDRTRSAPARHPATGARARAPMGNGGRKHALPRNRAETTPGHDALPAHTTAPRNAGHDPGTTDPAPIRAEASRERLHHTAARARRRGKTANTPPLHKTAEAQTPTTRENANQGMHLLAPPNPGTKPHRLQHPARKPRNDNRSATSVTRSRTGRAALGRRSNCPPSYWNSGKEMRATMRK